MDTVTVIVADIVACYGVVAGRGEVDAANVVADGIV